ncbi:MAG: hypothetical protein ACHQQR_10380, partial [Gemmatimonadales bacterium]
MSASLANAARDCLRAAIHTVNPRELTAHALRGWRPRLEPRSLDVISVGKAAVTAANGHLYVRGDRGPIALV